MTDTGHHTETAPEPTAQRPVTVPENTGKVPPPRVLPVQSRARFLRLILWMVAYGGTVLFAMSVILFHGVKEESEIILGIVLVALALIVSSYGLQ